MLLLLTSACLSRKEVNAELWQESGLPPDLCAAQPALSRYGIYRKLDSGKTEFISYCTQLPDANGVYHPAVQGYTSINTQKLLSVLDELLPEPQN